MKRTTTKQSSGDSSVLKFADMLDTVSKITPVPVRDVEVGIKVYKDLQNNVETLTRNNRKKPHITNWFGVRIFLNPRLKPNQCKLITAK